MRDFKPLFGLVLFTLLALPPIRVWFESRLIYHLLGQLPLLAVSGYLLVPAIAKRWPSRLEGFNAEGFPGILLMVFVLLFWMLPRSLDAALTDPEMEIFKFISVPLLIGVPLAFSWPKLHIISKGFVWANLIAMLMVLGWLYLVSPVRLCNYYLQNQQEVLGQALLLLGAGIALFHAGRAFVGHSGIPQDKSEMSVL